MILSRARRRLERQKERYALVDGIPFRLPVRSIESPALMAAFSINAEKAKALLPGNELHPFVLWKQGLLMITVIDYRNTNIGKYIEFSIGIACTHGRKSAPPLLPGLPLLMKLYGTGQYVFDLPVSTEISVKGGKGIWGMPKHQANLNFVITEDRVSSQYDLDGQLAMKIEIARPKHIWLPAAFSGINYCQFRGLLAASYINVKTKLGLSVFKKDAARLVIGGHPRLQPLKEVEISKAPVFTAFLPEFEGILDDHFDCWFISHDQPPTEKPEGLESVVNLGLSEQWLAPPKEIGPVIQSKKLGISFSETMSGAFSLGESDPAAGAKKGEREHTSLAMHTNIEIDDIDRFVAERDHQGTINGSIDFPPLGAGIPGVGGTFNLFYPANDPKTKYMVYELAFQHQGKDYYLAGKKLVHDDAGPDMWKDTTTLYTTLHVGKDSQGQIVGSGVLSLGVADLVRLLSTMKTPNADTAAEKARAITTFGKFFLGELWEQYAPKTSA